jgi:hypothetical protein
MAMISSLISGGTTKHLGDVAIFFITITDDTIIGMLRVACPHQGALRLVLQIQEHDVVLVYLVGHCGQHPRFRCLQ